MDHTVTHSGSCHCGAVRFEVEAPARIKVEDCNCSICRKSAYVHLIVASKHLRILQGKENLSTYTFNTGTAKHMFCKTCGVKSFYVPRSHPTGYSVNVRSLDSDTIEALEIEPFDGRNWEANIASLRARDGE